MKQNRLLLILFQTAFYGWYPFVFHWELDMIHRCLSIDDKFNHQMINQQTMLQKVSSCGHKPIFQFKNLSFC
jgi:hypothetical protein